MSLLIKDPTRQKIEDFYTKYAVHQSEIKSKVYIKFKLHCDVCKCYCIYERIDNHIVTKKHQRHLKTYREKLEKQLRKPNLL